MSDNNEAAEHTSLLSKLQEENKHLNDWIIRKCQENKALKVELAKVTVKLTNALYRFVRMRVLHSFAFFLL